MTKKYNTTHEKEHKKQLHCPTCNKYKAYNERYPDYVCANCVELAADKDGKLISFYNVTVDGHGCQGKYAEGGKLYRGNTCFIKGVKCKAEEAYMGGIVIQPARNTR